METGRHRDRRAGAAVFQGVGDEIVDHLLDLVLVAAHRRQAVGHRQLQRHLLFLGLVAQRGGQARQHGADIDLARRLGVFLQLDAREREQVADEARHAPALVVHHLQEPVLGLGIVARRAAQGFDAADQGGQRRADLVAGVGDEIDAHLFGAPHGGDVVQGHHHRRAAVAAHGQGRDIDRIGPLDMARGQADLRALAVVVGQCCIDRLGQCRIAHDAGQIAPGGVLAEQAAPGAVQAHHAAVARQQQQGIGQRVEQAVGLGLQGVDAAVALDHQVARSLSKRFQRAAARPLAQQRRTGRADMIEHGKPASQGLDVARQGAEQGEGRKAQQHDPDGKGQEVDVAGRQQAAQHQGFCRHQRQGEFQPGAGHGTAHRCRHGSSPRRRWRRVPPC